MQLVTRSSSAAAVRKDEYFQADMSNSKIRACVDAVVADPNAVMRVLGQPQVMACLHKLRGLRDVINANGGGPIDMDEILEPWTTADDVKATGDSAANEYTCTNVLVRSPVILFEPMDISG